VARTLREAQDHFSKAAEIETRAIDRSLLSDNPEANPSDALAALNEYRLAHATATQLIQEQSSSLKQDNLLGAAYMLKAMALWRMAGLEGDTLADGKPPEVTQPAGKAVNPRQELLAVLGEIEQRQSEPGMALGTRDRVLHRALYGFYDHDGGRAERDYTKARAWFQSAYSRLHDSLAGDVPPGHPIRVYVGSAQLRTLAAWNLALYNERKNCKAMPEAPSCALLNSDQTTINDATKNVVCGLQPFWNTNDEIKKSLRALAATIGLPSVIDQCSG
jgi:hypothetical protein